MESCSSIARLSAQADVWAVPVTGDKKPFPLLQSPFTELFPQVSPDGKWLAYQSNETGRTEIYIKPFPEGPGKWQVSTDGGKFPRWRGDGKELYFVIHRQHDGGGNPRRRLGARARRPAIVVRAGRPPECEL